MKNTLLILLCTFWGVLTLMLIMTMYGRIDRSMELKSNVSSIAEEVIENVKGNQKYEIRNRDEFVADFVETLVYTIDARSDLQVDIFQCDKEKGVLGVAASLFYEHPNGKTGKVATEKTVIYNHTNVQKTLERFKIKFLVEGECYKILDVYENSIILEPIPPNVEGKTFVRWLNADGTDADFSKKVEEDAVYYADIK